MGYVLLWLEDLAFWLLLIAWAVSVAVRVRRRWLGGLLVVLAIAAPVLLWSGAAGLAYYVNSRLGVRSLLVPTAALSAAILVAGVLITVRGFRRDREKWLVAHSWDPRWLMLSAIAALLVHGMTFWNLDLTVRQQLEALRVEAGALALAGSPPQAPDRENAALLYQQAFEAGLADTSQWPPGLYGGRPKAYDDWLAATSDPSAPLDTDDLEFTAYISRQAPLLKLVRQAAALPECSFNRDWGRPRWDMLLPEIQNMRFAANDLRLEAHYRAAHGDIRGALENIVAQHQMAEHAGQEPLLVCMLVSVALDNLAVGNLEHLLQHHPVTREDLAVLEAWRPTPAAPRLQRAFRMEEAFGLAAFSYLADRRQNEQTQLLGPRGWTAITIPLYRVFVLRSDLESYRESVSRMQHAAALPYRQRQEALSEIESALTAMPMGIITSQLLPAVRGVDLAAGEAEARQRLAHLAIAAHRYRLEGGEFPSSIDELAASGAAVLTRDPFGDDSLKLVSRGADVVLYSIGPNTTDDGGAASENPNLGDLIFTLRDPPSSDAEPAP